MLVRSAVIRLTVKLGITVRRCALCSGSSTPSSDSRRLPTRFLNCGVGEGNHSFVWSADRRWSMSNSRAAATPVTSHTTRPS
jgi:hypothetical protein